MKQDTTFYPMSDKFYFIIYKGSCIAYGKCVYDNIHYILFEFHAIKKDSLFDGSFEIKQNIRFRRPFDGFNFEWISSKDKPFKKTVLKYYRISSELKDRYIAKKKTK
jgi:hypothetical protein